MARRQYKGNSQATTITSPMSSADLSMTVADGSTLPTGTNPFVLTVDYGATGEEKVLCSARVGNAITISTRGYDGTTAAAHAANAVVRHTLAAVDLDEANAHVNATAAAHAATAITFTPTGNIAAATVQAAIAELDTEKLDATQADALFLTPAEGNAAYTSLNGGSTTITTNESTTSAAYTDLTTVGPDVTFTAPPSGNVSILIQAQIANANGSGTGQAFMSVEVVKTSDSSVYAAASDSYAAVNAGIPYRGLMAHRPITGLTPGTVYRARAKYRGDGATCNFLGRVITVTSR